MMQPKFNAEMAERTRLSGSSRLLAGSGCLEFPQGIVGMDSLNKHVEQISFWQWVTFCAVAKISISTIVYGFAAVS